MLSEQLVQELRKLNRTEKLRAVQLLVNDLAAEEATLIEQKVVYDVWSPYDSADAAGELMKLLEEDKRNQNE